MASYIVTDKKLNWDYSTLSINILWPVNEGSFATDFHLFIFIYLQTADLIFLRGWSDYVQHIYLETQHVKTLPV